MLIWLCALLFRAAHRLPSEAAAACAGGHYDEYVADFHDWRPGPIADEVWETPDVCRDHPDAMQAHHVDSGLRLEVARQAPNRHWGECWSMQGSRHWETLRVPVLSAGMVQGGLGDLSTQPAGTACLTAACQMQRHSQQDCS